LHRIVREHLETFLALARAGDPDLRPVRPAAERALREYLRCGIPAHGFARVRCASCAHEYLVAFSCKVRDLCPSCGTRRMVETAAHLVDAVLPRVPYRQWVLSVPKRVRWFLKHEPEVVDGLARVFLRLVESTLRRASPAAPRSAQLGAILFVHRFGDALNSHVHFHVLVTDGLFSAAPDDPDQAVFHPAVDLDAVMVREVGAQLRRRGLRWLVKHEHLDAAAARDMQTWDHDGGWSVDARVQVPAWDRHGLERLARYCARPALAGERLGRLSADTLVYRLRRPALDGRTEILLTPLEFLGRLVDLLGPPRKHRHRYYGVLAPAARLRQAVTATAGPAGTVLQELEAARAAMGLGETKPGRQPASRSWALLLARIYENRPLQCPQYKSDSVWES
jgi:ribosomal protein S27E